MKSYCELINENVRLRAGVDTICYYFEGLQANQFRVVNSISKTYIDDKGKRVIPFGMFMAMIYAAAFHAIDKPLPTVSTWEKMFPIEFTNEKEEPEECATLIT